MGPDLERVRFRLGRAIIAVRYRGFPGFTCGVASAATWTIVPYGHGGVARREQGFAVTIDFHEVAADQQEPPDPFGPRCPAVRLLQSSPKRTKLPAR